MRYFIAVAFSALFAHATVLAQSVDFIEPKDNATLSSPFKVKFGLAGMQVAPAGEMKEGTGHHHLLINAPDVAEGTVIPMDDQHRHFGAGQTETSLTLPAGKHTLQLLLGDFAHVPHQPPVVSKPITITVE